MGFDFSCGLCKSVTVDDDIIDLEGSHDGKSIDKALVASGEFEILKLCYCNK